MVSRSIARGSMSKWCVLPLPKRACQSTAPFALRIGTSGTPAQIQRFELKLWKISKPPFVQTHAVGGHTVLLVVGKGEDGSESEIWGRSIENIRLALPLAAELGIYIAIENVWNQFLYDHSGGSDQTAEKFVKYVDEFNSPWVGMQFDIGNHWKYGDPAAWIRTLGKRVVKLDIKGFSRAKGEFTKITDCDIDWGSVRTALNEIGFTGWCAAEVQGGKLEQLKEISREMDLVLSLKE